ncbi:hypothetical protein [Lysinibacter sp. HNR]|uniref:hypothetical protein n=1 Tax=Lysinibacter sp. HNR TaxID=3031408 RepID=UPI0024357822|nr:hypothetical protein [Lysinibacter sp. HNR]WGD38621.1 hypothetical protein FrondiHNR_06800 [Lysinibacter sp. HNR]
MLGSEEPPQFTCSRAGCSQTARDRIEWRNPKIHTEDRVKVWLACDEHSEFLTDFLRARSFPVRVVPLGDVSNT